MKKKFKNTYIIVFLILVITNSFICITLYQVGKNYYEQIIKENLLSKANLFQTLINPNDLDQVIKSQDGSDEYKKVVNPLIKVHEKLINIRYVYTIHEKDGKVLFGIDTSKYIDADNDGVIDHSDLNSPYENVPDALIEALKTRKIQITEEPYTDQYGTFISIFVPIQGKTLHILGIDMLYSKYQSNLNTLRLSILGLYLFLITISSLLSLFIRNNDKIKVQKELKEIELAKTNLNLLQEIKMSELGKLMASINHEINNPLQIIQMYAKRALKKTEKSPDEEFHTQTYEKILTTIQRIVKIITFMKSLVKDNSKEEKSNNNLKALIEQTIDFISFKLHEHLIEVSLDIDDQYSVFTQTIQTQQVILNLMTNSIDAIKELEDKWIHIKAIETQKEIILVFSDSGNGIPAEIINQINNDQYFTTTTKGGSGMGMMLIKSILKNNNASIEYVGEKNTVFHVRLPKHNV